MKTWLVALGVAFLCSSCGKKDENFTFILTAEKNVAARLKDPGSARFPQKTFIVRKIDSGLPVVAACGVVDGKNAFGAYTGGVRFVVKGLQTPDSLGISIVQLDDPTDQGATVDSYDEKRQLKVQATTVFEKVYWNEYCVDDTHPPTYTGLAR